MPKNDEGSALIQTVTDHITERLKERHISSAERLELLRLGFEIGLQLSEGKPSAEPKRVIFTHERVEKK